MIAHINPKMPLKQAAAIVGWAVVAAVLLYLTLMTAYWATKKPLVGPSLPTEKMGKPTGGWVDWETDEVRSVQESLKGHTTVLVFSVYGNAFVGHPVGSMGYQDDLQRLGSDMNDALTSFITLTGDVFKDDGVRLVIVRMDPVFNAPPVRDRRFMLNACGGPCAHNLFLAGQNKGGRYGNHYDLTYKWYTEQFIKRTEDVSFKNKTERYSASEGMHLPAYAITDKDGDIRYLHDGFNALDAHAALMHVLGKKPNRTQVSLSDFRMPLEQRNWMRRFFNDVLNFTGILVALAIILGIFIARTMPDQVVIVERKKR